MLLRATREGLIEGIEVGKNGIDVSHLQFANDIFIFCLAKFEVIQSIRWVLDCFALMFELTINYSKSTIILVGDEED